MAVQGVHSTGNDAHFVVEIWRGNRLKFCIM